MNEASNSASQGLPRFWVTGLALASLTCLLGLELAGIARAQSQTWDEGFHLLAGYRYWQAADFGINSEHPPLAKDVAAIPLLFLSPRVPAIPQGTSKQEGFVDARLFLDSNDADALLFACRMAAAVLMFLLALLIFEMGARLFGAVAGLLGLFLAVFEPNLLAHGSLVNNDVGASLGLVAAVYAFYRWTARPTPLRLIESGLATGLCLAAKHSGLLVFPILGLLCMAEIWLQPSARSDSTPHAALPANRLRRALALGGGLAVIGVVAWLVLWSAYGFRYRARPLPLEMKPPLADYVRGVGHPALESRAETGAILALARWKMLPESYLYGLADVLTVSAGPRPTFIFGRLFPSARWYYFPAVLLIKSTLGFLILLLLVPFSRALRASGYRREIVFLAVPPAVFLAVSMTSGLNVGVRHILPIYPFLLLLAAAGAASLVRQSRRWACAVAALLLFHAASSLHSYPDYIAYSNEAWGGPSKTYQVLSDSNVDYGQSLKAVRDYLGRHHIGDCWMAYFGSADPNYYGIPCKPLPDPFTAFWGKPVEVIPPVYEGAVLISATELDGTYSGPGHLNPYGQFQRLPPDAVLAKSVLVYHGRFDMAVASALGHSNRAFALYHAGRPEAGLEEARRAVELAPNQPFSHYALGYCLELNRDQEHARVEYATALGLARTTYPEYLWYWIPFLEGRLSGLNHP